MSKFDGGDEMNHLPLFGFSNNGGSTTEDLSLLDVFDDSAFRGSSQVRPSRSHQDTAHTESNNGNDSCDEYYDDDEDNGSDGDEGNGTDGKKRKRIRSSKNMTEDQKVERRERNREHAKRSRVRKKFLLESLQHSVKALEEENDKLRNAIRQHVGADEADNLLKACLAPGPSVLSTDSTTATRLDDPDYSLVKALQTAQQNFVITDPALPDNPIVYASQGFLTLTGYSIDQVLGRNCRFLQGPLTNPRSVDKIRQGIEKGEDTTVVLLNYRQDGSTFWNQFFIAALRDGQGSVVNFLGVQCMVSEEYAQAYVANTAIEDAKK